MRRIIVLSALNAIVDYDADHCSVAGVAPAPRRPAPAAPPPDAHRARIFGVSSRLPRERQPAARLSAEYQTRSLRLVQRLHAFERQRQWRRWQKPAGGTK